VSEIKSEKITKMNECSVSNYDYFPVLTFNSIFEDE
jgi:hypothetical protein